MKIIIIYIVMGLTVLTAQQDAAGQYKLSGVDVLYTFVTRAADTLTVTDAYGLGITQVVSIIPAAVPFTTKAMKLTDAALGSVGINLNVTLNEDGSGAIAEGSYYPDVNTIEDGNGACVTLQQVLPVTDEFTYTSMGNMMASVGMTHPGMNVLGLPGISTHIGSEMGGFSISSSQTFEDFPMYPTHPELCPPDAYCDDDENTNTPNVVCDPTNCFPFTVGDIDESGTIEIYPYVNSLGIPEYVPGGAPLTGVSAGYFLKRGLNSDSFTSVFQGNTEPDFILEWHGVDGALADLGWGDDEGEDEDGDGTWFDRTIGIPGITATYMDTSSTCGGYNLPIYGDVSAVFPAECVTSVDVAASGYLMDPSGALAAWGNFLTANGARFGGCIAQSVDGGMDAAAAQLYCGGTYPDWLTNDSDHDLDATGTGRLTMNFDIPCVPIIEAREVVAEFIEVGGEGQVAGCMDVNACNYAATATYDDNSCVSGQMEEGTSLVPCYAQIGQICTHDCSGNTLSSNDYSVIERYSLDSIYPNPFNPVTLITFNLPIADMVSIKVFDITGRELVTLKDDYTVAGTHTVNWNASRYPSGVYLLQMASGSFSKTQKIVLMK